MWSNDDLCYLIAYKRKWQLHWTVVITCNKSVERFHLWWILLSVCQLVPVNSFVGPCSPRVVAFRCCLRAASRLLFELLGMSIALLELCVRADGLARITPFAVSTRIRVLCMALLRLLLQWSSNYGSI